MRTAFLVGLVTAAGLAAQTDPLEEALRVGGDRPADLTFELRLPGGRSVFRPGEPIVVELVFQAEEAGKYRLQVWSQIWHQVPSMDRLEADPAPVDDLLAERHRLGPANGINWVDSSGGMDDGEQVVPVEMNATLRVREPGIYHIRAASRRALLLEAPGRRFSQGTPLILVSEPISITITDPDPEWERQQLERLLQELEQESPEGAYPRERLLTALRMGYLSIPEAADAIVERIGWENPSIGHNLVRALMASPHRERALQQLNVRIEAPDQAISERYITALVTLQAFFQGVPDIAEERRSNQERTARLRADVHGRLAAALPSKTVAARALCLNTLLFELTVSSSGHPSVPRTDWEPLRQMFAPLIPELPPAEQESLLANRWEAIRHPSLRPYLLRVVESGDGGSADGEEVVIHSPANRLRGTALMRLSDLAPQQARRIVLREAAREKPTLEASALVHLPDAELPAIDPRLLERLRDPSVSRHWAGTLLERYGTAEIYEQIREIEAEWAAEGPNRDACSTEAWLLAYYLRVDEEYGLGRVAALAAPGSFETDGCRIGMFNQIVEVEPHPGLEGIVRGMLDDPSPTVVSQAAGWLAQHGRADATDLIWARFEAFHAEWQGRAEELEALRGVVDFQEDPVQIERGLASALLGREADRERIVSLCVTAECRETMGGR